MTTLGSVNITECHPAYPGLVVHLKDDVAEFVRALPGTDQAEYSLRKPEDLPAHCRNIGKVLTVAGLVQGNVGLDIAESFVSGDVPFDRDLNGEATFAEETGEKLRSVGTEYDGLVSHMAERARPYYLATLGAGFTALGGSLEAFSASCDPENMKSEVYPYQGRSGFHNFYVYSSELTDRQRPIVRRALGVSRPMQRVAITIESEDDGGSGGELLKPEIHFSATASDLLSLANVVKGSIWSGLYGDGLVLEVNADSFYVHAHSNGAVSLDRRVGSNTDIISQVERVLAA